MGRAESARSVLHLLAVVLLTACEMPIATSPPEVHGHRGCRGLLPENTVPAFLKAAELGVDWVELDVVISADSQVVVSHEPWMHHRICLDAQGAAIDSAVERGLNLYRMTVAEIQRFDCGSLDHPDFPSQDRRRVHKPTLREVVEALDEAALMGGSGSPGFNIEIKSDPALYGTHQPRPAEFAQRVLSAIDSLGLGERVIIQSFDPAVLMAMHGLAAEMPMALLVENTDGVDANLQRLSFKPAIYSPHFSMADAQLLRDLRGRGIALNVWTVNEPADIQRMIALGVDGIISDYPDRVINIIEES